MKRNKLLFVLIIEIIIVVTVVSIIQKRNAPNGKESEVQQESIYVTVEESAEKDTNENYKNSENQEEQTEEFVEIEVSTVITTEPKEETTVNETKPKEKDGVEEGHKPSKVIVGNDNPYLSNADDTEHVNQEILFE